MTVEEKKHLKRILQAWGESDRTIRTQNAEIAEFRKTCEDIERVAQPIGECQIISIEELRSHARKLGNRINNRIALKTKLDEIIADLPYDMQTILKCRYINKINWEFMPVRLPFYISERQCYRLHSQAMEIIFERLKQDSDYSSIIC